MSFRRICGRSRLAALAAFFALAVLAGVPASAAQEAQTNAGPDAETLSLLKTVLATNHALLPSNSVPALTNTVGTNSPAGHATVNAALRDSRSLIASNNLVTPENHDAVPLVSTGEALRGLTEKLGVARQHRLARLFNEATPVLVSIILTNSPTELKRTALVELALCAQEQNHLMLAQQIFTHYLTKWPDDVSGPEIMLRQGLLYRQMGMNNLALTKFYAVMTSSLMLRVDNLDYYQRLVLQAQTEIADTYYQQGKFQESVDYFNRLLKLSSPLLNRTQTEMRLVRSLEGLGRHQEVIAKAYDFLSRNKDAPEEPEVRFNLATALKQLGRNNDSLQQVLTLLQTPEGAATPQSWAYWQQRAGNVIANQFYKEGDYMHALEVYLALATANASADWQLPVWYQIGLTYEKLEQPAKAIEQYAQILKSYPASGTNSAPAVRTIFDMARWRQQFLTWQTNAELAARSVRPSGSFENNAVPARETTGRP